MAANYAAVLCSEEPSSGQLYVQFCMLTSYFVLYVSCSQTLRLAERLEVIGFLRGMHARPMFFTPLFEIQKSLLVGNAILWTIPDGFCIRDEKVKGV